MEEPCKAKQHARPPNPSPLREVQQVPFSDEVVFETQLEATEDQGNKEAAEDDLDAETLAFLQRTQAKRSEDDLQPSPPAPQGYGISKPTSTACLETSFFVPFAQCPTNKPPPVAVALASQHIVRGDTAKFSIETATKGETKQSMGTCAS